MGGRDPLWFDPSYVRPDGQRSMAEIWTAEEVQRRAEEERLVANAKADAKAVWLLADYLMPPDIKELGGTLQARETIMELWRNAFIAGWRAKNKD